MARSRQLTVPPPYVSFRTFMSTVDWLEQEGLPQKFDDSIWKKRYSSAYGAQLMAAFRFLGLVGSDDSPTDLLAQFVFSRGQRGAILSNLLRTRYSFVDVDLARATPAQLDEQFRTFGLEGDTLRKATTFFVHAAIAAELQLSPYLTRRTKGRTPLKRDERIEAAASSFAPSASNGFHPALIGLLNEAQREGATWTKAQRDRWLAAWAAVIEMLYPVGGV
jgi:hypothetical protein